MSIEKSDRFIYFFTVDFRSEGKYINCKSEFDWFCLVVA